jgi:glucokinase
MPSSLCLALDVGATKLGAALVDRQGDARYVAESRTPEGNDPEVVFSEVTKLLDGVLGSDACAPLALGVGSAGPMTDGSQVSPLNIPAWRGFPLRRRLEDRYGIATFVELDTKALALAEGWRGAARGRRNYLAMVVSTGIGGGLVLDGRLVEGRTGNAGHVGHVLVTPGGRLCSCGGSGCLEAEASGWAIAEITGRPPSEAGPETIERAGFSCQLVRSRPDHRGRFGRPRLWCSIFSSGQRSPTRQRQTDLCPEHSDCTGRFRRHSTTDRVRGRGLARPG